MQPDDPWTLAPADQTTPNEPARQSPPSLEEALLALDHRAAPVFAVLDGAQFDDLPRALLLGGFVHRPLYLDRGDNHPERVISGPQMIWLDERDEAPPGRSPQETIPALLALTGDRPAAVFWQCPADGDTLYRHLRGINMVMIPRAFAPPAATGQMDHAKADGPPAQIAVMFRHADANVLAQTLPALSAPEAARFFGPASRLLFMPAPEWGDGGGWMLAEKPHDLPEAQDGMLCLGPDTLRRIGQARERRSLRRTAGFLRRTLPPDFQNLTDHQLDDIARASRESGKELGIGSLGAHQRWAYLMAITQGEVARDSRIRSFIQTGDDLPDRQVKIAMTETLAHMRQVAAEVSG